MRRFVGDERSSQHGFHHCICGGGLAQKVIQTFVPAQDQVPILQFAGDFDLGADTQTGLRDGYYVILGTRDNRNPIPSPLPALKVTDSGLLAAGQPVTQLSYVVLDVTRVPVRTRALNEGAVWDRKLREAETTAQAIADDPFVDEAAKRQTWDKCKLLLQEARALLLADTNYAPQEAEDICKSLYKRCSDIISGKPVAVPSFDVGPFAPLIDSVGDRVQFAIAPDEDLAETVSEYEQESEAAMEVLKAGGLL